MEQRFGPIRFLPGPNKGKYPNCHSLYVEADRKVLIDPASDRDLLAGIKLDPGVDSVWLSHYHEDHFMHLDLFEDRDLYIAEEDAPALKDIEVFMDYYGMTPGHERDFWAELMVKQFNYRPRTPKGFLKDGQVIDLGGVTAEIIHTPGHTRGHCAFYFREERLLFLGDYDLTKFGPWYGDEVSDIDSTIESVNRLRAYPAKVWIAAHEDGVFRETPPELWDNYLSVIDYRESRLLDALKEPKTIDEIVLERIIYRKAREPREFYDFGERSMMMRHLERLMKRGVVEKDGGVFKLA